jgi:hypothetical protein
VSATEPADRLATAVDRLVRQIAHWQPGRWSVDGRGDRVYGLVQRLADRGAEAELRRPAVVPRLADAVLPDQLRVMADDLSAAGAPAELLAAAADDVDAVRRTL